MMEKQAELREHRARDFEAVHRLAAVAITGATAARVAPESLERPRRRRDRVAHHLPHSTWPAFPPVTFGSKIPGSSGGGGDVNHVGFDLEPP